mgnify:CR=1 FL=1
MSVQCSWSEDENGTWGTGCGHEFEIMNNDTPSENDMAYCCYCGKHIREVPYRETEPWDGTTELPIG